MAQKYKRIGILGRSAEIWPPATLSSLSEVLEQVDSVRAEPDIAGALPMAAASDVAEIVADSELVIIAGGDGTLLSHAWALACARVSVTGINFGRLGFLADIAPDQITRQLPSILAGHGILEERLLLKAEWSSGTARALNEVLVHAPEVAHLIEFEVFVDDRLLYRIRADGIIVATPTGSTAYALSAGGAVLAPDLPGLTVVPMLAHGPGSGAIVLPEAAELRICNAARARLTLDGTTHGELQAGQEVRIGREARPLRLLHPEGQDFFARIRDKLGWGFTPGASGRYENSPGNPAETGD